MLHLISLCILLFFLLEIAAHIYVHGRSFFTSQGSFWSKLDLLVVVVSLAFELVVRTTMGPPYYLPLSPLPWALPQDIPVFLFVLAHSCSVTNSRYDPKHILSCSLLECVN